MATKAERNAEELLERVWARGGPVRLPVDPFLIAERLGITTYLANLSDGVSGIIRKRAGQDAEIYLNVDDHRNRQRFTCAHELGHYDEKALTNDSSWEMVEHRDLLSTQGTNSHEIYANQFAASLLMPEKQVRERHETLGSAVTLAYEFGVSTDAMTFRLKNLHLI